MSPETQNLFLGIFVGLVFALVVALILWRRRAAEKSGIPSNFLDNSERWLTRLTPAELAHWKAKPQSDKDWWYANTEPEDRQELLQGEIEAEATHKEFLKLPQATRDAVVKQLSEQADAARARIQRRRAKQSGNGE